jgi:hypothetical protein
MLIAVGSTSGTTVGKVKVIISKHERKKYITQCGNREWVSVLDCISQGGAKRSTWIIFKGKALLKEWGDHLPNGHITISDNGWTDNKLFLEWLEHCFEPETRKLHGDSEYRMLIVDGHASMAMPRIYLQMQFSFV